MPRKSWTPFVLLTLLVLAALACTTITGGPSASDLQATADAIEAQAEDIGAEAQETAEAAEATAEAALDDLGNDNANDNDNENADDNENGNDNANDNENGNGGSDDDPFDGQGPEDVPVFTDAGDLELLLGDDTTLTYFVADTDVDEVADFYREAMPDAGWELMPNGDNELGPVTSLLYEMDGRTATITINTEFGGDRVMVTVFVTES